MKRKIMTLCVVILMGLILTVIVYNIEVIAQVEGVVWSKQLGTVRYEEAIDVALDGHGKVIVIGATEGSLFSSNEGEGDIFIVKYDEDGKLIWDKQFGTKEWEKAGKVSFDPDGNIYVVGFTRGNLFGKHVGGDDAFIFKLSPKGDILWAKQFGTPKYDRAEGIAIDDRNKAVYVVGFTAGSLYRVNPDPPFSDVFVIKYDFKGNVIWQKQFGDKHSDWGYAICVDGKGHVYVAGETMYWFGGKPGEMDAFIAKFSSDGSLIWGKQFGTVERDYAGSLDIGGDGNIYIVGAMNIGEIFKTADGFVVKYDPEGNQMWLKELRTEEGDAVFGVAVGEGRIYVVGHSAGDLFGKNAGGEDIFLARYDVGGVLISGEILGTDKDEIALDIAVSGEHVYIVGMTKGNLFGTNAGDFDAFVVKLKR